MNNGDTDIRVFLTEKATNFRTYLLNNKPDAELSASIKGFEPDMLMTTLYTVFLPGVSLRGLQALTDELTGHLDLTDADAVSVRDKVSRYLQCFYEVLTEQH